MSSGKPTKEGELKKYKNILQGWGTRYFKLERSYFHYFETKHAPSPIDTFNRGDISQVITSNKADNAFEVHTKSGMVWYLRAHSEDEMMSWMGSLKPDIYTSPSSNSPQLSHQNGVPQRSQLYPSLPAHGLHVAPSSVPSSHPSGAQYNTPNSHTNTSYNHHLNPGYHTPPNAQYGTYTPPGVAHPSNSPYSTPPGMQPYNPTPPGAQYNTPPGVHYSTPPGIPYGATHQGYLITPPLQITILSTVLHHLIKKNLVHPLPTKGGIS